MELGDVKQTDRGFEIIEFEDANGESCSLQQSSAIDDRDAGIGNPGTSFLWLGRDNSEGSRMHLTRTQAKSIAKHLNTWLKTGSLK